MGSENNGYACTDEGPVPRNMTMIPAKLKTVGYRTAQIGKWHMGQIHNGSLPVNRGYDSSFGYLGGAEDHYTNKNGGCGNCGGLVDLWRTTVPATGEQGGEFAAYKYNREALKIIQEHAANFAESPLFMYLALQCAHGPNQADKYANLYPVSKNFTKDYADYNGMISAIDDVVGNVTKTLKKVGMWSNTLIVFTSDNGGPSAKSVSGHNANNWPLRGGKHTAWEGGHRVLGWVSGGIVPEKMRGKILEGYVHGADWYATFANLAGADPKDPAPGMPPTDSIDMWPYLSGKIEASPRTELLLSSRYAPHAVGGGDKNGSSALIVGDYKLVRHAQQYCFWMGPMYPNKTTDHSKDKPCNVCGDLGCLFNIKTDPGEHVDLAKIETKIHAELYFRALELDKTSIEAVKGPGWRGDHNSTLACEDAKNKYGGFWGPDLFP